MKRALLALMTAFSISSYGGIADELAARADSIYWTALGITFEIDRLNDALERQAQETATMSFLLEYNPENTFGDWETSCNIATEDYKAAAEGAEAEVERLTVDYEAALDYIDELDELLDEYDEELTEKHTEIKSAYDQRISSVVSSGAFATKEWCVENLVPKNRSVSEYITFRCDCVENIEAQWDYNSILLADGTYVSSFSDLCEAMRGYVKIKDDNGWIMTAPAITDYPRIPQ